MKKETLSTNEDVKALPSGSDKIAVCAAVQTGGRGRMGRHWVSPEGNLYVSLCLELGSLRHAEMYSFLSAVALADAIEELCAGIEIKCKWPNDLLIDGKKASGILLETDGKGRLIVGIGVNVVDFPTDQMLYPVTSLAACGFSVTKEALLEALLKHFDLRQRQLQKEGKTPLLDSWRKRAYGIGAPISVNLPDRQLHGIFGGLDQNGCLLLNKEGEEIKITVGDVFFGRIERNENG